MFLSPRTYNHYPPLLSSSDRPTHRSETCGFAGNNDIYGTGIRIGIYSQILAVWFANYFLLSEAQVLRDSVTIFSVAVLVVSFLFAANPANVFAAEAFVLLQILAWTCMMGVRAKSSFSSVQFGRTLFRTGLNELINLCMVSLHVWFWWRGLDDMKKTPCGTYLMYVVKTDMFGWARSVMKALSVFVLVATVYWVSVEFLRPWTFLRLKKARQEFVEAVRNWEEAEAERVDLLEVDLVAVSPDLNLEMHDSCSKYSCSRCSPVETEFRRTREDTLVETGRTSTQTRSSMQSARHSRHSRASIRPETSIDHSIDIEPRKSMSDIAITTQDQSSSSQPEILRRIHESELYILHCIAASPYKPSSDGKNLSPLAILRSLFRRNTNQTGAQLSWLHCHIKIWTTFITFQFPAQSFAVYSHLRQARLLDPLNGPFQIYASLTYGSSSLAVPTPTYASTCIASSLLVTAPETPKKVWLAWYYTLLDLFIHVVVILQLELTLAWNHVEGLSDLWTSVGQLIPFIIGVSGLVLVLGRWGLRWLRKRGGRDAVSKERHWEDGMGSSRSEAENCEEDIRNGEIDGLSRDVRDVYARWKERYGKTLRDC